MQKKPKSKPLNKLLGTRLPVLDHGFVKIVDYMGNDSSVVQAARVSYGKGTKTPSQDRQLIRYLLRHKHWTPFEQNELKLHLKVPLFVARQWLRHRTASVNELSGRYSEIPEDYFLSEGKLDQFSKDSFQLYQTALKEAKLSREDARTVLPLNFYTEFYWKIDLRNLLHFLELRNSKDSQREIREYAKVISGIVSDWVPLTYEAFQDYILESVTLSQTEIDFLNGSKDIRAYLRSGQISRGESREFLEKLNKLVKKEKKEGT